jgi:sulfite exporter TauE/SafE
VIELPLIFLGGLLGSAHCIGMCGGFAVTVGLSAAGLVANLRRQLIYSTGRIFTYAFLGIAAGFAGSWFANRAGLWINAQASLCVLAGFLLTGQGLLALGLIPRPLQARWTRGSSLCLARSFLGPFLASSRSTDTLVAGVLTGFLPCGLVYGFLALASSSASISAGLLIMILFGAGTAPLMLMTGAGASLLSYTRRQSLLRVSAICVFLTGLVSIARGMFFLQIWGVPEAARCLLCGPSGG